MFEPDDMLKKYPRLMRTTKLDGDGGIGREGHNGGRYRTACEAMRVENARYDGGEPDSKGSLFRLFPSSSLCEACTLVTSFEEIGEGTQGERGGTASTSPNQHFEHCDRHEPH